ncbi:MAG: hypothetical protein AUJ48_01585 [Deltaproteobacteria bacterium CG1_02_45_11]|nr:MAG: hypothetical protein AUJ48_01585 [Deltaproteobacteria bacterium CG1_02_45_11]
MYPEIITTHTRTAFYFKHPAEKLSGEKPEIVVEDKAEEKESDQEEYILCRQCRQIITSWAERIEVQGSHQHAFANPHGIVYQIGCFKSVRGCRYAGPATEEWSWFRGFSWRIAVCSMCLTHLGWFYMKSGYESFNGLILDRLVFPE